MASTPSGSNANQQLAFRQKQVASAAAALQQSSTAEDLSTFNYENVKKFLEILEGSDKKKYEGYTFFKASKNASTLIKLRNLCKAVEESKAIDSEQKFQELMKGKKAYQDIEESYKKTYADYYENFQISGKRMGNFWSPPGDIHKSITCPCKSLEEFKDLSEESLKRTLKSGEVYDALYEGVAHKYDKKTGALEFVIPPDIPPTASIQRSYDATKSMVEVQLKNSSDRAIWLTLESNRKFPTLTLGFPKEKGKAISADDINEADVNFVKKMMVASRMRGVPIKLDPEYEKALKANPDFGFSEFQEKLATQKKFAEIISTHKRYKTLMENYDQEHEVSLTELVEAVEKKGEPGVKITPPKM